MNAKTIKQIADEYFGGSLTRLAEANNTTQQMVSRWKKLGYVVIDGVVMCPRRSLLDASGNPIRDPQPGHTEQKTD